MGSGLVLEGDVLRAFYGSGAGTVAQGNDPRLSDARAPSPGSPHYLQSSGILQTGSFSLSGTGETRGRLTTHTELLVDGETSAEAPTSLLRVLNSTSTPPWSGFPLFTVDSAGGLLARSELGYGVIPMTGKGYRLMWHPAKAAFRAGYAMNEWDEASTGFYSWAGGTQTTASAFSSFAFGDQCAASGTAAVCFGSSNKALGAASFTAGTSNTASGIGSTAIGYTNVASGQGSVALGYRVTADSDYGVALGNRVSTNGFAGSFIWGDQSTTTTSNSTAANQFMVRAAGGVRLRTSATLSTGCDLPAGSGVFSCTSDRELKEDFRRVDGEALLAKVVHLPVDSWRYKDEARGVRHVGPVAQDFRAAFGLGTDDKSIGLLDIDGVNLAAIKALALRTQQLQTKTAEVDALKAELTDLKRDLAQLQAAVRRLDAR